MADARVYLRSATLDPLLCHRPCASTADNTDKASTLLLAVHVDLSISSLLPVACCALVPPETDIPDRHTTFSSWFGFHEDSAWHSSLALETVSAQSRLVQVLFLPSSFTAFNPHSPKSR